MHSPLDHRSTFYWIQCLCPNQVLQDQIRWVWGFLVLILQSCHWEQVPGQHPVSHVSNEKGKNEVQIALTSYTNPSGETTIAKTLKVFSGLVFSWVPVVSACSLMKIVITHLLFQLRSWWQWPFQSLVGLFLGDFKWHSFWARSCWTQQTLQDASHIGGPLV